MQGGRAAAVVLAEPWGEEPSTFPAAGAYAKNDVCDKKRWNQGGGKAFNRMGTAKPPNASKNRVHFRGVSAPSSAKDSLSAGLVTFPLQTFSVSKCKTRDDDSHCLYNQSEVCENLII